MRTKTKKAKSSTPSGRNETKLRMWKLRPEDKIPPSSKVPVLEQIGEFVNAMGANDEMTDQEVVDRARMVYGTEPQYFQRNGDGSIRFYKVIYRDIAPHHIRPSDPS